MTQVDPLRARAEQLAPERGMDDAPPYMGHECAIAWEAGYAAGRGEAITAILAAFEDVTRVKRRACSCPVPDPVMQADGKFYCYACSFETGARPSGLEPERFVAELAAERRAREAAEQALRDHVTLLVWEMDHGNADSAREVVLRIERLLAATRPPGAPTP